MIYHYRREILKHLLTPFLRVVRNRDLESQITLMLHVGRCGSTVLGDLLNQNPKIHWDGEIFPFLYYNKQNNKTAFRSLDRNEWKKHLKFRKYLAPGRSYGLEVKFFHCRWLGISIEELIQEIKKYGHVKVVVLERKNLLRSVVSQQIALRSGNWHSQEVLKSDSLRLGTDDLFQDHEQTSLLKTLDNWSDNYYGIQATLKKMGLEYLWLTYEEDIESDPLVAYNRVIDFVKLESDFVPKVKFRKAQKKTLRELLENYVEVENVLSDTKYLHMLDS